MMSLYTYNSWSTPYLFNGKEYDEETGLYYYGARYYDPRLSLWLSPDRYQEKYPNISTYAYAANSPVRYIDERGDSVAVLIAPNGAHGAGHMAILIQDENGKWALWSKNGTNKSSGMSGPPSHDQNGDKLFTSPLDFLDSNDNKDLGSKAYTEAYVIPSTREEDTRAEYGAQIELNKNYNVAGSNCAKTVQRALSGAGIDDGSLRLWEYVLAPTVSILNEKIPNRIYDRIVNRNPGEVVRRSY